MTTRLYWEDDRCFACEASVVGIKVDAIALDRTCSYPGGGGQPSDSGTATFGDGRFLQITGVRSDEDGTIWHSAAGIPGNVAIGSKVRLDIDRVRRIAFARYHTVLHILNTIALREHDAWITGAQIGADYFRIDFRWDGFSPAVCAGLEARVNAVIAEDHPLAARYLSAEEFAQRPDLLRTLEVRPPVIDGRVRVVAICGFDEQACGGTHVGSTAELGQFSIYKTENKGKINKRLYVRLLCG